MTETGHDRDHLLAQQTALARFGELALRCEDLDDILQEACALVGRGLQTDLAKVMELVPDSEVLAVRAGVGWKKGVVGREGVSAISSSGSAYALKTGQPVISADTDKETRFEIEDFLRDHGVKALVNVLIERPHGAPPFGILEVDSRAPRQFTGDDISFLQTYANLIGTAVTRLQILEELRASVTEKERLFDELQHRVKNNLQVVASLVSTRRRRSNSDEVRNELASLERRVETLRLVHDKLHSSAHAGRLDLGSYLAELAGGLMKFHGEQAEGISLELEIGHIVVEPGQAIPAGLIVNEFITNSLKHAFEQGCGIIGIEIARLGAGKACLRLWDNGNGLPLEQVRTGQGSGLQLIEGLARQLGSDPQWEISGGTRLTLEISTVS